MDDCLDLWQIYLEPNNFSLADCLSTLSKDEQKRAEEFVFIEHQRRYVIGRYSLRKILSQYLGNSPSSIKFSYNPYGKPYIKNNKLEFNMSNSNEYAVLAISNDTPTGVDIEHENAELDLNNMALAILSKNEYQQFLSLKSRVLQEKAFYRAWTCKEAFTKCLGLGFSFDVKCCQFNLNPLEKLELFSIDYPGLDPAEYFITRFNTKLYNYAGVVVNKYVQKKLRYYNFNF